MQQRWQCDGMGASLEKTKVRDSVEINSNRAGRVEIN